MTGTNNYPGIGFKNTGYDNNFFEVISTSATAYGANSTSGQQPDAAWSAQTDNLQLIVTSGTGTLEFSFNGNTTHGQMTVGAANASLTFINRPINMIWFRVASGSSGSFTVSVSAW